MSILTLATFVHNQTVNLYNHLSDQEFQTKTNNGNVVFPVVNEIFRFMELSYIAGEWFYNAPMLTEMKVVTFESLGVIYCKNKTVESENQSVYPDFSMYMVLSHSIEHLDTWKHIRNFGCNLQYSL